MSGAGPWVSILIVVDLPAPLGPRNAKMPPASTSKLTSFTAVNVPKVFGQIANVDDRGHVGAGKSEYQR